ncbi:M81 family metallopeptidase [Sphingomonas sp.]|jgi:microcystin degradation protein MlrC|uniref:M81 family metallopeptidase n=1 Tax=Sphingomonas sp. TaxID=28214 RepID=UPI002DF697C8|nr:M81 family metallopeptidase [Sphingomonas sp.]
MRIFLSALATETNTFAPFPTGWRGFEEYGVKRGADLLTGGDPVSLTLSRFAELARSDGHEVVEGISAMAQPSGRTVRSVYEELRDEIVARARAAGPVHLILLVLHGAMVADGYDDCEGDLLTRLRAAVGPSCVIGAQLDPHCHLTEAMVEQSDVLIPLKEYPHTDFLPRADELYSICTKAALQEVRPVPAVFNCRMVGIYPTAERTMSGLLGRLDEAEQTPGILSASFIHGFPWADVADVGSKVLVYSDGRKDLALACSELLGRDFYSRRQLLLKQYPTIEEALDLAETLPGPVVLADTADNPGGGAPGDDTRLLAAMIRRGLPGCVSGCHWDPIVAETCADAGVGARLAVRLGGKCGPTSGDPIDLQVEVRAVKKEHNQRWFDGGEQNLGLSVWLRAGGVDVVASSVRTQVFSPDAFTGLGIDLRARHIIAVKSSNHFYAAFRPLASSVIHVGTPGALNSDLASLPYTKRDDRFFPRIEDPLQAEA